MIFSGFQSALTESLDALHRGATVDQCLSRYPRHEKRLRPLLAIAAQITRTRPVAARPAAQERAWNVVRARAAELRAGRRAVHLPGVSLRQTAWLKPAALTAAVLLAVSAAGGGAAVASQSALPDSPLYGVKLMGEDVRLWFVFDETNEAEILLDQSNQRMEEVVEMVRRGNSVPENALSDLHDRNARAASILEGRPHETALRARVLTQAQQQEDLLVALWAQVPDNARSEYAQAVAQLHNARLSGGSSSSFVSLRPEDLTGGILSISGAAEQVKEGVWLIGGVEVRVDERTLGRSDLQNGSSARLVVGRSSNGRLYALSFTNLETGPVATGAVVSGAVEQVTSEGIVVAGQLIPFSDETLPKFQVKPGQRVQITLETTSDGVVAGSVDRAAAKSVTFEGTASGDLTGATGPWLVGGLEFEITESTAFDARGGNVVDGARVQVEALNIDGRLEALRVMVLSNDDAADTAAVIGRFEGFSASAGVWRIGGLPIIPPETAADPALDSLVIVEARRQGTDLAATRVTTVEAPEATGLVRVQGTVGQIDGTRWSLEFGRVRVASIADVTGEPQVGVRVIVWGERGPDGSLQAVYARVLDDRPIMARPGDASGDGQDPERE